MQDWTKQEDGHAHHPMLNPASAAKLLAEVRTATPATAVNQLSAWLGTIKATGAHDERTRAEILSMIEEAAAPHQSALFAQLLGRPIEDRATREANWKALVNYLTALTGALHASVRALLTPAAAARCLHACRMLTKACLFRYVSAPPKLWRLAYAVHESAEKAGCAATPVRIRGAQKTTTVTHELLRLLMLQASAPQMMSPAQIEVTDRVADQMGEEFILRPRGVADGPFCFEPSSERPPRRAAGAQGDLRYFGPGTAFDSLQRMHKQLLTTNTTDIKAFGRDIAPHAQVSAIEHLLAFWAPASPYSPPARSPATGQLAVVHRYAHIWQHISQARSAMHELLSLAQTGDNTPAPLEMWDLQHLGGNEVGAQIGPSGDWAQCGDLVSVSIDGKDECCLGFIRSMHAEPGRTAHANIAILTRQPQAVELYAVASKEEKTMYSAEAARQFAFNCVRAIIVSDDAVASQKPTLLLPLEAWKAARVYEVMVKGATRYLRIGERLQRGDDYVRATFEWVVAPSS